MPSLSFESQSIEVDEGQSVLQALLSAGHEIPHSCEIGACQTCIMQCVTGDLPAPSQTGLKDVLKAQNYFLACRCFPKQNLSITRANEEKTRISAHIHSIQELSSRICKYTLKIEAEMNCHRGQYLTLWQGNIGRSYSVADINKDENLFEFHIAKVSKGEMTTWLFDTAKPGDKMSVQGPAGDCFYVPSDQKQPILMVGTGTGLAPLYGILQDAILASHEGEIHLFQGALYLSELYYFDEISEIINQYSNVKYHPCCLNSNGDDSKNNVLMGDIVDLALALNQNLAGWRIYLCGAPDVVKTLRKKTFLAGAKLNDIYSDAFISPANRDTP